MRFVGLDLGTSFIKGAVLDLDEPGVSNVRRVPFPEPCPGSPPLHHEVEPLEVVGAADALLDELIGAAPDCAGVVLCAQMHGLVLADERGRPLSRFISWRDQRAAAPHPSGKGSYFDLLRERISDAEVRALGSELGPGLPVAALFWLAENGGLPRSAIPASLPDFVVANLAGTAPVIERTCAAAHGLLDLGTLDWHRDVIERLGLGALRWTAPRRHVETTGALSRSGRSIPVHAPVGDHQCALAGALLEEGELSINISTGSQVSVISPAFSPGEFQTRPFFDGRFLDTITHIPAGRALDAIVGLLTELPRRRGVAVDDPWEAIARAAAEVEDTDLRVDLSFFRCATGEEGGITNIREENLSLGHLFRAAFEGMAANYHRLARRLSPAADWTRIVFSGGLAVRLEPLRAAVEDLFRVPARLAPTGEDTLIGLLALALDAAGRTSGVDEAIRMLRETYERRPRGGAG